MKCENCGKVISPYAKVCLKCGQPNKDRIKSKGITILLTILFGSLGMIYAYRELNPIFWIFFTLEVLLGIIGVLDISVMIPVKIIETIVVACMKV